MEKKTNHTFFLDSFFKSQEKGDIISLEFVTDRLGSLTEKFLDEIFGNKKNNISVYAEYLVVAHPTRQYFLIIKIETIK